MVNLADRYLQRGPVLEDFNLRQRTREHIRKSSSMQCARVTKKKQAEKKKKRYDQRVKNRSERGMSEGGKK